jgi:hypothetical protein
LALAVDLRLLVFGDWFLVIGFGQLVVGCWLLVLVAVVGGC